MRVLKRILTLHDLPMHDCVTEEMHVLAAEDPTYKKWAEIIECLKQKSPPRASHKVVYRRGYQQNMDCRC